MKKYIYKIYDPGEQAAGLRSYSDTVEIVVHSGDPGGDYDGEDSFQEHMYHALSTWFDGADVSLVIQ